MAEVEPRAVLSWMSTIVRDFADNFNKFFIKISHPCECQHFHMLLPRQGAPPGMCSGSSWIAQRSVPDSAFARASAWRRDCCRRCGIGPSHVRRVARWVNLQAHNPTQLQAILSSPTLLYAPFLYGRP